MDSPATYLNWNFILISIPNVLVVGGMIVLFIAALVVPFPGHDGGPEPEDLHDA